MTKESAKIARTSVPRAVKPVFDEGDAFGVAKMAMMTASEKCGDLSESYLHVCGVNAVYRAISQAGAGPREMQRPISLSDCDNPSIYGLASTQGQPEDSLAGMAAEEMLDMIPTPRQRAVVEASVLDGRSRREIGADLKVSADGAHMLKQRGLQSLRKALAQRDI